MIKRFLSIICTLLVSSVMAQSLTKADFLALDTLKKHPGYVFCDAVKPIWDVKSPLFWYRNNEKQGVQFYLVNAQQRTKQKAFDHQKLAEALSSEIGKPIDPFKLPFSTITVKGDSIAFSCNGINWLFCNKNNSLIRKSLSSKETTTPDNQRSPQRFLSPNKKWEAYIRDSQLYLWEIEQRKEYRLSYDGTPENAYSGGIFWSPDSKKIAVLKVRKAAEHKLYLIESSPESQLQPILHTRDYYKPGDVVPIALPHLFDVEKKEEITIDTRPYEHQYSLRITGWRGDSRGFLFEFNQRGHQLYQVAETNASNGSVETIIEESFPQSFVYYNRLYRYDLPTSDEMLWISERDGWRHLYLIDTDKKTIKQQITKGEWVVREVVFVDPSRRIVWFKAGGLYADKGEDPYNIHLCKVNFDGTGFVDLTPDNANHEVSLSADKRFFVDVASRPDLPPVSRLRSTDTAEVLMELEQADISALTKEGWRMPEVFCAKGRDGKTDIWGNIYRPSNFNTRKKYPVIEYIYAGPHDSFVPKNFSAYSHIFSRLAELGFIVVSIDGMGTANRSKAFHDVCWRNLKDSGFEDRISWIKAAADRYRYMDTTRVGIFGYSSGGQSALGALLFYGHFYKAAVSACGCHDNRMDKIWWNEQWMGYPIGPWYDASSNVVNAHRLKGDLLIVNGEMDTNVDPASTLQVVRALVKADKHFEQLYLPGYGHALGGEYELHRFYEFFVRSFLKTTDIKQIK